MKEGRLKERRVTCEGSETLKGEGRKRKRGKDGGWKCGIRFK